MRSMRRNSAKNRHFWCFLGVRTAKCDKNMAATYAAAAIRPCLPPHCFAFAESLITRHRRQSTAFSKSKLERNTAMAAYESSAAAPLGAVSIFRSVQLFSGMFASVSAWNDARVTRKALGRLSDRELDDIGLCRAEVNMIGR